MRGRFLPMEQVIIILDSNDFFGRKFHGPVPTHRPKKTILGIVFILGLTPNWWVKK